MNRARFENCATVITGASSGIGAALAWQFAKAGARTAIVARRQDRLERLAEEIAAAGHARPMVMRADLFEPEAATLVVEQARQRWGRSTCWSTTPGWAMPGPSLATVRARSSKCCN